MIRPERVEIARPPHRADIVGSKGIVVELQKSSIGPHDVEARESFYGDMVWLFDATFRFRMICSGDLVLFALGRNKHIQHCKKPVCLDFGEVVVEVLEFTDLFPEGTGIGRKRDRKWFASTYLSDVMRPNASLTAIKSDDKRPSNPWETKCPYETFKHPTSWIDPLGGNTVTFPKGTPYIWLKYEFRRGREPPQHQDERFMQRYPSRANGWTKDDIDQMKEFLGGRSVIVDGLLRVIPMVMKYNQNQRSISSTQYLLRKAEQHIAAGRLPILKEQTKADLMNRAMEYEAKMYGTPTAPPKKVEKTKSLFDD